ncbi:MAG TPA: hypothetical protein VFV92_12185, partial [Candidatus Bathyarchaeia archaeon]|nr:hypothetical protein [Candidatus Bathyarchaeia archaeon]
LFDRVGVWSDYAFDLDVLDGERMLAVGLGEIPALEISGVLWEDVGEMFDDHRRRVLLAWSRLS